jgi:glycosyltransferase involved in cell wall biosynthesis
MGAEDVYFHVGRFGHPFFDEQLQSAPEGFRYRTAESIVAGRAPEQTRRIALQGARLGGLRSGLERTAIRGLSWSGYVRRNRLQAPRDCSLIHSAQQLLRDPGMPYVVDFECVEVFCLYQRVSLSRPWARRSLLDALSEESCRFLLPWSQAAARSLQSALGVAAAALAHKTATVLPAIRPRVSRPSERGSGPLRVLFLGTAFEAKGGVEAVRAVRSVRRTHDVKLDLITDVPHRWSTEIENEEGITAHPWPASAERVGDLFQGAHLLLFPSHMDTLGFVMLEAMAHGVPVLATRHFAVPELVEDRVSGLLVEGENQLYGEDGLCRFDHTLPPPRSFRRALTSPSEHYIDRIADALALLAEDRELRVRLAAGALARVVDGPLSVTHRREALGGIYRRAVA